LGFYIIFYGKGSFVGHLTILFLAVDEIEKVIFCLMFHFCLGFVLVEVKFGLLCDF